MLELLGAIQPRFMCSHLRSWIEDSVKEGWNAIFFKYRKATAKDK